MSKVDEKIKRHSRAAHHIDYHKHEHGAVRRKREDQRHMKRVGWLSVEDKK
ncbi:hypothetical protein [Pseudomonas phage Achelous]|uniref:Uncharacterized protein n=1 Tax=Pseudomonas phage Achelous TaxID=2163982 RepID=A0A2S1GMT6_9CAUD|nr:hypothetical protein HOT10_gp09 [Pseudomonas phage Achelous]AWD90686.1 hypothetical protein [Pseudomonas phage Achelous]